MSAIFIEISAQSACPGSSSAFDKVRDRERRQTFGGETDSTMREKNIVLLLELSFILVVCMVISAFRNGPASSDQHLVDEGHRIELADLGTTLD